MSKLEVATPHILTAQQFTPGYLFEIFDQADKLLTPEGRLQAKREFLAPYIGRPAIYRFFFEPSTRTHDSFVAAADHLGMAKLGTPYAKVSSSAAKGESLENTIRTANRILKTYESGIIILRHPEEGSAVRAAEVSEVPVINAGDGQNEHPTQAVLDLYTIWKRLGRLDNLRVVFGGDPRYSRTVHSLVEALSMFPGNHFTFVADSNLWIDEELKAKLVARNAAFDQTTEIEETLRECDVAYWTRLQTERFGKPSKLNPWKYALVTARNRRITKYYVEKFGLTEELIAVMPDHAILMHPQPEGGEISKIDPDHPKNATGEQVTHGVVTRMAEIIDITKTLEALKAA